MDITQLRYFLKTAELLNYSKAADSLFIARQSLRQAICALEEEIGAPLFNNVHNKISLTEHGLFLVQSASQVVSSFDQMKADLQKLSSNDLKLKVGISESLFPFILPGEKDILNSFKSRFTNIGIELATMDADSLISAVHGGELDCGCIMQMPYERLLFKYHEFQRFDAAVTHNDMFAGRKNISLEDLLTYSCIGMASMENFMHPLWEDCKKKNYTLDYSVVSSTIDAYYLINHGKAVAFDIMATEGQRNEPHHFVTLDGYSFSFGLIYPESTSKNALISLFCRMIEEEYIKYKETGPSPEK